MCEVPHFPLTTTIQIWGLYSRLLSKNITIRTRCDECLRNPSGSAVKVAVLWVCLYRIYFTIMLWTVKG